MEVEVWVVRGIARHAGPNPRFYAKPARCRARAAEVGWICPRTGAQAATQGPEHGPGW